MGCFKIPFSPIGSSGNFQSAGRKSIRSNLYFSAFSLIFPLQRTVPFLCSITQNYVHPSYFNGRYIFEEHLLGDLLLALDEES